MFFLATLGLVLLGFSTSLYFLARSYLYRQLEERLETSLNTLVAAVEVGNDSVEWEPGEGDRQVSLGTAAFGNRVVWLVRDDQGRIVDQSEGPADDDLLAEALRAPLSERSSTEPLDWQGERCRCMHRWIRPNDEAAATDSLLEGHHKERQFAALSITAGISLQPVRAALRRLAVVLLTLSAGIWLVALFVGRLVCRRALLPVTRMARSARDMNVDDLGCRLPILATGDELENLGRDFNSLLDRLQESLQRQKRFTGDASHQLRTPLTAILGQIEVALRRQRPPEEYRRVLDIIHHKAERLRRIVESLLFLSRADTEACLPDRERIRLGDWLSEQLRSWSDNPRAQDIILDAGAAGDSQVEVQPALLRELVDILVDNACKYSLPETPIVIRLRLEESIVCLEVEDQGCGVAEAELPYLFTPFFRSAESRRRGIDGVGLGLSIASRLAHTFGGVLTVMSHVGQGSCFTLRLPRVETKEDHTDSLAVKAE
jgi:signal transduction histidine kinase